MRKIFFLLLFLALAQGAAGLGVAVSPDQLVFDGGEEQFRIINPNNESIIFSVNSGEVDCEPEKGELAMLESETVVCRAAEGAAGESTILVETEPKGGKDSVGMIPAVGVKVKIAGEGENSDVEAEKAGKGAVEGKNNQKESIENKAPPLTIEKSVQKPDIVAGEREMEVKKGFLASIAADMKMEMITIAILTAAILGVLAYSHVRERKGDKEKEKHKEKTSDGQTRITSFHAESNTGPRQEQGQSTRQDCGHP
jgi:hypothetical protein